MKLLNLVLIFFIYLNLLAQNVSQVNGAIEYVYDSTKTERLKAYIFSPIGENLKEANPAIVIFHGGGWEIGEPAWAFGRAKHFANLGFIAIAAHYRLSNRKGVTPVEAMADAREVIKRVI